MTTLQRIFILCLILNQMSAQPQLDWQKAYGGTRIEGAQSLAMASDGNYFVAGYSSSNNDDLTFHVGVEDCWVLKINQLGQVLDQKIIGGSGWDIVKRICATADGGCVIACPADSKNYDFQNTPANEYPLWIIKLDASLEIEWQKKISTSWNEEVTLTETSDNGFLISSSYPDTISGAGTRITKFNLDGAQEWQKDIHTRDYQTCLDMQPTPDGGYILTGTVSEINNLETGANWWVLKVNANLEKEWEQVHQGLQTDKAQKVVVTAAGEYVVGGTSDSDDDFFTGSNGNKDVWIVKMSANGTVLWKENYGGTKEDYLGDLNLLGNDAFLLLVGTYSSDRDVSYNYGLDDFWLSKLNGQGVIQWETNFGGEGGDKPFDAFLLADNSLLMVGSTSSTSGDILESHGVQDLWVAKTLAID